MQGIGCRIDMGHSPARGVHRERKGRAVDSFNPTTKTQAALTAALQSASAAGNPEIRPAHLLVALLDQTDGIAGPLLEAVASTRPRSAGKPRTSSVAFRRPVVRPPRHSSGVRRLRP